VAEALIARGDQVTCLVRSTSNVERLQRLGVLMVQGDLTNPRSPRAAVEGVDAVLHLAGLIKAFSLAELLSVNEQGVRNVVAACAARSDPPVLVVVSSLAAAGPSPPGQIKSECDAPAPVSNYGRSKRAGELAAEAFAAEVPRSIVRPPIVFGEGDPGMAQMFRPIARLGLHVVPGSSDRRFSLIHAADLAEALVRAVHTGRRIVPSSDPQSTSAAGYYFVAAPEQPTYAELGLLIGAALSRSRVRILRTPEWLTGVRPGRASCTHVRRKPSIFNVDKIREATAGSWICSPQRAQEELGFSVSASLPDGSRAEGRVVSARGVVVASTTCAIAAGFNAIDNLIAGMGDHHAFGQAVEHFGLDAVVAANPDVRPVRAAAGSRNTAHSSLGGTAR
jgi:nucleoside-diphosphate-sugar epimerase